MKDKPFLERIKSNRKSKSELDNLDKSSYREFKKEDSYKIGLDVIYFETRGKGEREVLQKIHFCKGDTGKIGETWGEIYLYNESLRLPRRFKIKSDRILIKKEN